MHWSETFEPMLWTRRSSYKPNTIYSFKLSEKVKPALLDISDRMKYGLEYQDYGTGLFEVYVAVKSFKEMKAAVDEE